MTIDPLAIVLDPATGSVIRGQEVWPDGSVWQITPEGRIPISPAVELDPDPYDNWCED